MTLVNSFISFFSFFVLFLKLRFFMILYKHNHSV